MHYQLKIIAVDLIKIQMSPSTAVHEILKPGLPNTRSETNLNVTFSLVEKSTGGLSPQKFSPNCKQ